MSTDFELLDWAAKAVGIEIDSWITQKDKLQYALIKVDDDLEDWNPLRDRDQAKQLRHLARLSTGYDDRFKELGACAYATYKTGDNSCNSIMQNIEEAGGKRAALRRAIVRAAAEIGKAKEAV